MSPILPAIVADFLWFLVFAGWVILIVAGLEADKPLSGGIPGHVDMHEQRQQHQWTLRDRVGEMGGWAVFGAISALLPVILYWVFAVHSR